MLSVHCNRPWFNSHGGWPPVELWKQIMPSFWILGNPKCLRSVADRFDFCKSMAYQVYRRVCRAAVTHLMSDFVNFPTSRKAQEVIVLGAIDGTHILIKGPQNHSKQYVNWKGFFSVQLQLICNTDLLISDAFCGYPGSVHNAHILCNSPFCCEGELNLANLFGSNFHILGDAAYLLKTWLLTPFRDNGHLTAQQIYQNVHSSTRMVDERCI